MRMQFNSLTKDTVPNAKKEHRGIVAVREWDLSEAQIWNPPQPARISKPGGPAHRNPLPYKIVVQNDGQIERLREMAR